MAATVSASCAHKHDRMASARERLCQRRAPRAAADDTDALHVVPAAAASSDARSSRGNGGGASVRLKRPRRRHGVDRP